MPKLPRFDTPARLPEPAEADRKAWDARIGGVVAQLADEFPQFFDPRSTDSGADAMAPAVVWPAFPATLIDGATTEEQRWGDADASRSVQDEYCEWGVERDPDGVITRVTFTTEVPEYFDHLAERDPDRLLATYHELIGPHVKLEELIRDGAYIRNNVHNRSTEGRPAHLMQTTNTLVAAVVLAAQATVLRHDAAGEPVTTAMALVRCGRLGEPRRNSDPQIAAAVNDAAATGAEISLQDPLGLYLDRFIVGGLRRPDGLDPAEFWKIERGTPEHAVRASYAVPPELGFRVGDITAGGRPIEFGAQLADRVRVRLTALVRPAGHRPERQPCIG